ncbi:hypothetical protein ACOME3_002777 [Neoechinorhynchus agilis]
MSDIRRSFTYYSEKVLNALEIDVKASLNREKLNQIRLWKFCFIGSRCISTRIDELKNSAQRAALVLPEGAVDDYKIKMLLLDKSDYRKDGSFESEQIRTGRLMDNVRVLYSDSRFAIQAFLILKEPTNKTIALST